MHLLWALNAAGMENGVINVCNRLPRDQFSASICTMKAGGSAESRVDRGRVELFHVPRYFGNDPTLPLRLALLLRRKRVDILHAHLWGTLIEGLAAAKLAGVRTVIHGEHGKIADRPRQIFAQRWAWRKVKQVLAVSSALADRMSRVVGFPRDAIQVFPNGVDSDRFRPSDTPKSELRRQFGLPPGGLLIGMVARLVGFKDHAGVLRAVANLRKRGLDAHLALAGDGPLGDELKRLAHELDIAAYVHFLGQLPRVEPLLGALDVFVSNSSHNEGMSNAMLEAMASGVPVVATRVAASPELLDEGRAGLLIPPRDAESSVQALRQLAHAPDMRISLGRAGRQRIVQRYGISTMVKSYSELYMRAAGSSERSPCSRTRGRSGTVPTERVAK